jgi:hypothetical protein
MKEILKNLLLTAVFAVPGFSFLGAAFINEWFALIGAAFLCLTAYFAFQFLRLYIEDRRVKRQESASAGWLFFDVADEKMKYLVQGALNGFVPYATNKGYAINFSCDASYTGRIGVKFTLWDGVANIDPDVMASDLSDYIHEILSSRSSGRKSGQADPSAGYGIALAEYVAKTQSTNEVKEFDAELRHTQKVLKNHPPVLSGSPLLILIKMENQMGDKNTNVNSPQSMVGSSSSSQSFISSNASVNIGNIDERRDVASELESVVTELTASNAEKHKELILHIENLSELLKEKDLPSQNMLERTIKRLMELLPTIEDVSGAYIRLKNVLEKILEA